jgi:hypothetical protein
MCVRVQSSAIGLLVGLAALLAAGDSSRLSAQSPVTERIPTATLIPATTVMLSASADSNSPAVWEQLGSQQLLFLFTSFAGRATRHVGTQLSSMASAGLIRYGADAPVHGVWMEAIVPDDDGTWYGYYHNELPAEVCGDTARTIPRIGAARSRDLGATWSDLGVILEAPRGWHDCNSTNRYFVGGVGDFSVVLDHDKKDLYFFFSQYGDREQTQGVAIGRMAWADRDQPGGRLSVWWRDATWVPTRRLRRMDDEPQEYAYPAGVPIYRAADGWHDGSAVDAFWGPSVHWNTYLEQYVMLLNRARDANWQQEGIYIAFAKSLSDPSGWSTPRRLLMGGGWYPQVLGTEAGAGTDKVAGERARFFLSGRSHYLIQFAR